uniref:Secreted protein n=1 Tax=Cercocebus atys TaxID=9531 RepID=A0A2K5LBD8_CERAT
MSSKKVLMGAQGTLVWLLPGGLGLPSLELMAFFQNSFCTLHGTEWVGHTSSSTQPGPHHATCCEQHSSNQVPAYPRFLCKSDF